MIIILNPDDMIGIEDVKKITDISYDDIKAQKGLSIMADRINALIETELDAFLEWNGISCSYSRKKIIDSFNNRNES